MVQPRASRAATSTSFGPSFTHSQWHAALRTPVSHTLRGARAYWMPIHTCDPMLTANLCLLAGTGSSDQATPRPSAAQTANSATRGPVVVSVLPTSCRRVAAAWLPVSRFGLCVCVPPLHASQENMACRMLASPPPSDFCQTRRTYIWRFWTDSDGGICACARFHQRPRVRYWVWWWWGFFGGVSVSGFFVISAKRCYCGVAVAVPRDVVCDPRFDPRITTAGLTGSVCAVMHVPRLYPIPHLPPPTPRCTGALVPCTRHNPRCPHLRRPHVTLRPPYPPPTSPTHLTHPPHQVSCPIHLPANAHHIHSPTHSPLAHSLKAVNWPSHTYTIGSQAQVSPGSAQPQYGAAYHCTARC